MNKKLLSQTLKNTSLAVLYIFIISQIMQNGSKLFGEKDNALMPFAILLLFSLSAAIVGGLIFGKSLLLFFENKKQEGLQAAFYSIGWIAIYTLLSLIVLVILNNT